MRPYGKPVHDVLGRMSDDDNDDATDPGDMELTFVPAAQRGTNAVLATRPAHLRGRNAMPLLAAGTAAPQKTETVYEKERNEKVRRLLAEQQRTSEGSVFSLDVFDAPYLSASPPLQRQPDAFGRNGSPSPATQYDREGQQRRGYVTARGRGRGEGRRGRGGARSYRMPNPNMTEEEQARFMRYRRNMGVIRNALREVDPETREYTQVTQAPDQQLPMRGRGGFASSFHGGNTGRGGGEGGLPYRGRGSRGGDGRGRGGYGSISTSRGRGGGEGPNAGGYRGHDGQGGGARTFNPY